MKRYALIGAIALVIAAGGYALGRFTAPERVRTVETVRTVEDTKTKAELAEVKWLLENVKSKSRTERVSVVKPDGTRETRTVVDRSSERATDTGANTASRYEASHTLAHETIAVREVERVRPQWRIGALGGVDFRTRNLIYGAHIERRILGPLSLGAWGLSSGAGGLSLSLEF